jgi:positive regulator of sigma E activity
MTILKMAVLVYFVPAVLIVVAVALMVMLKALTGL